MTAEDALRLLAEHHGLVRFTGQSDEQRTVRVMLRLPWSPEDRVVATQDLGAGDPLDVMLGTVQEALGEVKAQQARRTLRLA